MPTGGLFMHGTDQQEAIRGAIAEICFRFDQAYLARQRSQWRLSA